MKNYSNALLCLMSFSLAYGMNNTKQEGCEKNNPDIAHKLINAIVIGIEHGNATQLLQLLQDKNNNPNHYTDFSGNTPLAHLCHLQPPELIHMQMMKILLAHGARRDIKNVFGQTADTLAKEALDTIQQELNNEKTT